MATNTPIQPEFPSLTSTTQPFLKGRRRAWLTALLALCLGLALALASSLLRPGEAPAYAAAGEYSLSLLGLRPDGELDQSGYLEIPYAANLNHSGSAITIEAWVKRSAQDRHETLVGNGYLDSYWLGFASTGQLSFRPHGIGSGVTGNATVYAGVWTHIAVTYDGINRRYYINGVLDLSSSAFPGALTTAGEGEFLGIGFDRDDTFTPNYYAGLIDNVRIWNVIRSPAEIKAGMFQSFHAPTPGLLAEWDLDGDAYDPAGDHDGTLQGSAIFSNDGALPHDIRIPQLGVTPNLNGDCNPDEYALATEVSIDGWTHVWLMHTQDDLWICMDDLEESNEWAQVFLDPGYTRLDPAQPEHLLLRINKEGDMEALEGDGTGIYTPTTQADGLWDATRLVCCGDFPSYRAEFRINAELLGGWEHVIGLALGKSTLGRGGEMWPALAYAFLPSTWSSATLGGTGEARTFTGKVVYQPRDLAADPVGIANVSVDLVGSDPQGGEALVATVKTNLDGSFNLESTDDYTDHRLEMGAPPKGYLAKYAVAGPSGSVVDARTIEFGSAGAGTYPDNRFILKDALPYVVDSLHGPYFLIVASQEMIDSGALDAFVNYKQWLGFTVVVKSVEEVDDSYEGDSRLERIRNLEKARFNTQGKAFHQYLMLVGDRTVIPFAQFTLWFNGYKAEESTDIDLDACLAATPAGIYYELSDWYYSDLTSNFDSNGNGCLLDGVRIVQDDIAAAPGYTPDTWPNFQATVAVGRIPFNDENTVRRALSNIIKFEQQSESFKNDTLFAASHYWLKGQYWVPTTWPDGVHLPCPVPKDSNVDFNSKTCAEETEDAANYVENMKASYLDAYLYNTDVFYEPVKAPGSSPVYSPQPLNTQNVLDALEANRYGLVNLWGHGGTGGVYQTRYIDVNGNGLVDSPTEPDPFNINEIEGGVVLDNDGLATLTPDKSHGAVYISAACSTSSPLHNSFGATVLGQGHGVGYVGALNVTRVIAPIDIDTTTRLLKLYNRLGDALWYTLEQHATIKDCCSARWSTGLYGDPSLSYWGNPGGQATYAAWPMTRYNPTGQGYTPLAGPEVPKKLWEYSTGPIEPTNLVPSPVVSNNGEVIVAHGWYLDVMREGASYQSFPLDAPAYGTPAIAADGTVYVYDVDGSLYAFPTVKMYLNDTPFVTHTRYFGWKMNPNSLFAAPETSPVIGADGFIAVSFGYAESTGYSMVALIRPDGEIAKVTNIPGRAIGSLAVGADRKVYATTTTGYVGSIDWFGYNSATTVGWTFPVGFSTPPLLAYGNLYAGRADGWVMKLSKDNPGLVLKTFPGYGAITAGPVIGPAGQVLVGTSTGWLYSLNQDLELRWARYTGAPVMSVPAYSADGVYIVNNDRLKAYNPYSGNLSWERYLGEGAGNGSVAVGYGRELYLQTTGSKVLAYGEGWKHQIFGLFATHVIVDARVMHVRLDFLDAWDPTGAGRPGDVRRETDGDVRRETDGDVRLVESDGDAGTTEATTLGILLQRSTDGGNWEDLAILPEGTEAYTDTNVLHNADYAYRLQVLNSDGNDSDFSYSQMDFHSPPALPEAPALLAVSVEGAEALGLEWASPEGDLVDLYKIQRSLSESGPFVTVIQANSGITMTLDTGLEPGTLYFYRVIAANEMGDSPPSNMLSGITRGQRLPPPENASATLGEGGLVTLSWDNPGLPDAATVIEVSRGIAQGYQFLGETGPAGDYYHFPGEPDTYVYRLKFVLGDQESVYSKTNLVIIEDKNRIYLPLVVR